MDLPEDVFAALFQHLQKREYRAVASIAKNINQLSQNVSSNMQIGQGGVTAFYHGYQLTGYQHAMIKHILSYGAQAQYRCVPDTHNLFLIALLLAVESGVELEFYSSEGKNLFHSTYYQDNNLYQMAYSVKIKELEGYKELLTVRIGEVKLFLGDPATHLGQVHPEYANVQLYPVWVTPDIFVSTDTIPRSPVGRITGAGKITRVIGYMARSSGKSGKSQIYLGRKVETEEHALTLANLDKFPVLIADGLKPEEVYNVFSLLSQLRTSSPKMLIINNREQNKNYYDSLPIPGYIPLPFKFLLELPEENIKKAYLPPGTPLQDLSYAELLILEYYTDKDESTIKPVMEWLEHERGKKSGIRIKNSSDDEKLKVSYTPPENADQTKPWLMVDAQKAIGTIGETTGFGSTQASAQVREERLKSQLQKIIDDPRSLVGDLSKEKLKQMCKGRGIRCLVKDTRPVLARKLLDKL